jgi:hypothetical protein
VDLIFGRLLASLGGFHDHAARGNARVELLKLGDTLADSGGDGLGRLHVAKGDLNV